jgi:hypothetical protein
MVEERVFSVVSVQSPRAYRELFDKPIWGVAMTGVNGNAG